MNFKIYLLTLLCLTQTFTTSASCLLRPFNCCYQSSIIQTQSKVNKRIQSREIQRDLAIKRECAIPSTIKQKPGASYATVARSSTEIAHKRALELAEEFENLDKSPRKGSTSSSILDVIRARTSSLDQAVQNSDFTGINNRTPSLD